MCFLISTIFVEKYSYAIFKVPAVMGTMRVTPSHMFRMELKIFSSEKSGSAVLNTMDLLLTSASAMMAFTRVSSEPMLEGARRQFTPGRFTKRLR